MLERISKVTIASYGAKHNHHIVDIWNPDEVFNCHFISNPYNVSGMRNLTGLDEEIQTYVWSDQWAKSMYYDALKKVDEKEGQNGIFLAFECYGGKHRSVAMAEIVATGLRDYGYEVEVIHISLNP